MTVLVIGPALLGEGSFQSNHSPRGWGEGVRREGAGGRYLATEQTTCRFDILLVSIEVFLGVKTHNHTQYFLCFVFFSCFFFFFLY